MVDDDTYSSNDAGDINKRKRAEKNAQNLQVDDLKFLMGQPQFRRFMWHLLAFTQMHSVSDPREVERAVGFRDGMANIGLMYFGSIQEHCPDKYLKMVKDSQKKGNSYDD